MNHLFWTDNFCIEDNIAWAVSSTENILFRVDFCQNKIQYIASLSNGGIGLFRKNQQCIKCDNVIVCIPDIERNVYFYHIDTECFSSLMLSSREVRICNFWKVDEYLYMLSSALNLIFKVNVKYECLEKTYEIPLETENSNVDGGILIGESIYCVNSINSTVYRFYVDTGQFNAYHIPQIKTRLNCIGYDGENFLLSGCRREIYIWNPEQDKVEVLDCFPKEFGIYNYLLSAEEFLDCKSKQYSLEAFIKCVTVKNRTWFIPFQTNMFLYVDKDIYHISSLSIEDEIEDRDSLEDTSRVLDHKFLLEYVREDRYIGIYSIKNKDIFEIDSQELTVHRKKFELVNQDDVIHGLVTLFKNNNICMREGGLYRHVFKMCIESQSSDRLVRVKESVGKQIYQQIR